MIADLTAATLAARLRDGQLTATAVAAACLDRIARREPLVQAWSHLDRDRALADAARLDALPAADRGPLHGVPIGIKDVLITQDMPTRYGSALYGDPPPTGDAAAVALLRAAGALILGKTHTVEFAAIGARPPTRNPINPAHTPGGSSSGSAAAVADGHVPLALGTQTGGSIIRPAAFCGCWGFKPSWGIAGTDGAKAFAPSLDTIGWFGRSASDLALLHAVFALDPPIAATTRPCARRIAFCRTPMWSAAEPPTRAAFDAARSRLAAAGLEVSMLDLPASFAGLATDHETIMLGEGRISFLALARTHGNALGAPFREMVAHGPGADRLNAARDRAAAARCAFDALAADFDAILVPSTPGTAPAGLANGGSYVFNGLWTMLHAPCVHIPIGRAADGLPIGLTAIGPRLSDARVIAAAQAIGQVLAG